MWFPLKVWTREIEFECIDFGVAKGIYEYWKFLIFQYTNTCDDPGVGYALLAGDCNDADSLINPAAAEIPDNAVDENCDGQIVNGVADLKLQSLYVFPNPSSGVIEILGLTQTMQMEIFDVLGNLVFSQWVQKNERIHLDALSNGVYMIRLGNKYTQRIILAK